MMHDNSQVERAARPFIHPGTRLPIFFVNDEWAVTSFGLESVCACWDYYIDAARLAERHGDRAMWPFHMEGKGWTDPRLFLEAFRKALEIHGIAHDFDWAEEQFRVDRAADLMVARREARRRRAAGQTGSPAVDSTNDSRDNDELKQLIREGFRAPPFPVSCMSVG